jgi:CheY-like chemotaxis protein
MLTAMSDRKYVDEAFLEGATDYVTKPFDLLELRGRMRSAQSLMQERQKSRQSMDSARALKEELDCNQQFNFDDPLTIAGVDRLLKYVEFDNYIAQLSRGRLFNSRVLAVKLQDSEFFYDLTSCTDFRRAVEDLARCIARLTKDKDCIFSYRGCGTFLVIGHSRDVFDQFPSEERLNHLLGTLMGQRRAAKWVGALIGESVSMRSLSKAGAFAAVNSAIQKVEMRETKLQDSAENALLQDLGGEPERREIMHRRVYEKVLLELFGDETYLAQR